MKNSSTFTRFIASIGLIGVLLFLIFGSQIKKHVEEKVFDSTYQFFLITIVGGGVSLIYEAYRHERESRESQKEVQRNLRSNFISSYNNAKQARRLLRARAIRINSDTGKEIVLGEELLFSFARLFKKDVVLFSGDTPPLRYFKGKC